jgi:8-oxo-dGTP diphosphatase
MSMKTSRKTISSSSKATKSNNKDGTGKVRPTKTKNGYTPKQGDTPVQIALKDKAYKKNKENMQAKGITDPKKWGEGFDKEVKKLENPKTSFLGIVSKILSVEDELKTNYKYTPQKPTVITNISNSNPKPSNKSLVSKPVKRRSVVTTNIRIPVKYKYRFQKTGFDFIREYRSNKAISKISNFIATGLMSVLRDKNMNRKQQNLLRSGLALLITEGVNFAFKEQVGIIDKIETFYTVYGKVYKCIIWVKKQIDEYSFEYEESVATCADHDNYEKFKQNRNKKLDEYFDYKIMIEKPITVKLDESNVNDSNYIYSVIACKFNNQWLFCKNKNKETYEMPGGKREENESIDECAKRELMEETGALKFDLSKICNYSVTKNGVRDYGTLYFADISLLGELTHEIKEIKLYDDIPTHLTYKEIQVNLFNKAKEYEKSLKQPINQIALN